MDHQDCWNYIEMKLTQEQIKDKFKEIFMIAQELDSCAIFASVLEIRIPE